MRGDLAEHARELLPDAARVLQFANVLATTGGIETCVPSALRGARVSRHHDHGCWFRPRHSGPPRRRNSGPLKSSLLGTRTECFGRHGISLLTSLFCTTSEADRSSSGFARCTPTLEVVHTTLCAGGKLFRNGDRLCGHPVGRRCLLDWYVGPCGSSKSPVVAATALRSARSYIDGLRRLDTVVVGSEYMREYLIGEGIERQRIVVARLDADRTAECWNGRARAPRDSRDAVQVLFVGRVVYNKGLQYLLRAFADLDEVYRLEVAGDGWFAPSAREMAQALGVSGRTRFRGNLVGTELEAAYRLADIVVVPSLCPEPVGLVVGEARRHSVPVIVSDAGGLAEWANGDPGVVVVPRADAPALAAAIRGLRRGPERSLPSRHHGAPQLSDVISQSARVEASQP